jgi:flagellin
MSNVINTNVKSLVTQDSLTINNRRLDTTMQRLSTGSRINSAKDDAAGLGISTRMEAQSRGLTMAIKNANDGISLMQTAEGAMEEVTAMLQRMRELAVQSANGTNNGTDRTAMDAEVQQLKTEIDRVAKTTQFNNINLLDGSFKNKALQIGDKGNQTLKIDVGSVKTKDLGLGTGSGGSDVLIGGRLGFTDSASTIDYVTTATSLQLIINGVAIDPITSATSGANNTTAAGVKDINDVVIAINRADAGVEASAFNEIVAKTKGTGILSDAALKITVSQINSGSDITYTLSETKSMDELVNSINSVGGAGTVQAKVNADGKLVLFNSTGATITVSDTSSSGNAVFDGNSGFSNSFSFKGMLKLESTNGKPITVGTDYVAKALHYSDEFQALSDLGLVSTYGYRTAPGQEDLVDQYSVRGHTMVSDTQWAKGEISINGVDIFRSGQSTNTAAKKIDLINSFADQTGVTAQLVSDTAGLLLSIRLNSVSNRPISINLGDSLAGSAGQSDFPGVAGFAAHGLRETNVGAADFDTNEPTYGSEGGGTALSGMNVSTVETASAAIGIIDNAIENVSSNRAKLGAYQNRLVHTVNNLDNIVTNTEQSKSRIKDTDYAVETTALARQQIIQQAATAMLAQANQAPQSVLALLR